jgi:hypothetical protein
LVGILFRTAAVTAKQAMWRPGEVLGLNQAPQGTVERCTRRQLVKQRIVDVVGPYLTEFANKGYCCAISL